MFTGIIETLGKVQSIVKEGSNIHITITSSVSSELKVDQSVAHDGVCLTVVALGEGSHTVTAIKETLDRTNLGEWEEGSLINIERAMKAGARLDGHLVQGHVDATAKCVEITEQNGSWEYRFRFTPTPEHILVDKGSVCVNGVSLTVVNPKDDLFTVAIIPFTIKHTNFQTIKKDTTVNLEFDIIGKYISRYADLYLHNKR